jgi:hypothetical protein
MSDSVTLAAVAELATQLPIVEQRQLAESILQRLASATESKPPRHRTWREIRGSVPHPLCGEDAQTWVSRGRRESEEPRDQPLSNSG